MSWNEALHAFLRESILFRSSEEASQDRVGEGAEGEGGEELLRRLRTEEGKDVFGTNGKHGSRAND